MNLKGVDQGASGASMDAPGVGLLMELDCKWSWKMATILNKRRGKQKSYGHKRQSLIKNDQQEKALLETFSIAFYCKYAEISINHAKIFPSDLLDSILSEIGVLAALRPWLSYVNYRIIIIVA